MPRVSKELRLLNEKIAMAKAEHIVKHNEAELARRRVEDLKDLLHDLEMAKRRDAKPGPKAVSA